MSPERRNYYRILQVQPEALPEVVKASWRALMHAARGHPDLGGDPQRAALLNEAYAVIGDPVRRGEYDRRLRAAGRGPGARPAAAGPATGQAAGPADPRSWRRERCCPMCRAALPAVGGADPGCSRCGAPLWPAPEPVPAERELFGRRSASRRARGEPVTLQRDWREPGAGARLLDVSLSGAALASSAPAVPGTAVRVAGGTVDAVARVVAYHASGTCWHLRVEWLTVRRTGRQGVYLSTAA